MKKYVTEKFCDVMSYLTVALGVILVALVVMNYPKITSLLDRTLFNQNKAVSSSIIVDDNTEWKNLDESERVLKAIEMGGITDYLNSREIELYNETVRFMNSVKGKSDYEVCLAAHDWICDNVTYDDDAAKEDNDLSYVYDSTSSYGGVVEGYTICGGYAESYQLLTKCCGIETYYVVGKVPEGGYHAWNISRINDQYYAIDCTYDDNGTDRYKYFMVSDEFMKNVGREWSYEEFPACTDKQYEFARYTEFSSQNEVFDYIVGSLNKAGTAFVKTDFEIDCFDDICESVDAGFAYSKTNMDGFNYYAIEL